jgi:hypothetical protein
MLGWSWQDMTSKADLLPIVLGAVGLAIAYILFFALGLNLFIPSYVAFGFELAIYLYAAYWALDIRKGLHSSLFHRQALGIAIVALGFGLGNFLSLFLGEYSAGAGILSDVGFYIQVFFIPLIIFYWLDSTILASRRADPLGRDALHWTRVRRAGWILMIVPIALNWSILIYGTLAGYSQQLQVIETGGPFTNIFFFDLFILVVFTILSPILLVTIIGLVYLPVIARRSKDHAFRYHIIWFVLFVVAALLVSEFAGVILSSFLPPNAFGCIAGYVNVNGTCVVATNHSFLFTEMSLGAISYLVVVIGGLFLYRSVKSLVPMNRRSPVEVKKVED